MQTNETLSKLSVREINVLVAKIERLEIFDTKPQLGQSWSALDCQYKGLQSTRNWRNFCFNAGDIMPIAIENQFIMVPHKDVDDVVIWWVRNIHIAPAKDASLLRAICHAHIIMNQQKVSKND